jgi:hypothetical protein
VFSKIYAKLQQLIKKMNQLPHKQLNFYLVRRILLQASPPQIRHTILHLQLLKEPLLITVIMAITGTAIKIQMNNHLMK